jgi:tetratricopeptide (TPR) repeat protein
LWLAPGDASREAPSASREFSTALSLVGKREYTRALAMLVQPAMQDGPLGLHAEFYAGRAQQELGRHGDALRTFQDIQQRRPVGYLSEAAALAEGESHEALNDHLAAAAVYERLTEMKTTAPDDVLLRLGRTAKAAGDLGKASRAFARVYYEFPLGDFAETAGAELQLLSNGQPVAPDSERFKLELGRAQRLYSARQYAEARAAFERVRGAASGDESARVRLRLAECEYYLKRYRAARDGLRPFLDGGPYQAEALYFHALP